MERSRHYTHTIVLGVGGSVLSRCDMNMLAGSIYSTEMGESRAVPL